MHQKRIVFAFTVQQKQPPIWSAVVLLPGSGGLKSFQQKEKADVAMKYYCPGTVFLRNTEKYIWIICDKEQTDLPLHLSMPLLGFDLNLTQVHSWQKTFTEKYTHSTWCHHCPKDGHHHAAILPKDTFHASSSWDHPQSKFNSVKLAASLFFDLMDMISRSLLTDTSLVTSYSSLSHRITHTLQLHPWPCLLALGRRCSLWAGTCRQPAPGAERNGVPYRWTQLPPQGSCFKDSPNPLRWNTQGLALCNHLRDSGHIFIWSPRTKTSQVGSILWVSISFRFPFLQLIS